MFRNLVTLASKTPTTPLGRWGVTPDKIMQIYNTSSVYDHSLDEYYPNEFCEFHVKEYINYCTTCHQLMDSNRLEYKNDKYGYLHKKYCRKLKK